jgi:hypothetical protein
MDKEYILDELGNKSGNNKAMKIKYIINNDCWECISHKDKGNGYIEIGRNGRKYLHRYVYEIYYGEIPKNMVIMHKCDNRKCINPSHLKLGTHQDNMNDKINKGRYKNGMTGKKHTEEWKKERSNMYSGEGNPMYGKKHSKETLDKISDGVYFAKRERKK